MIEEESREDKTEKTLVEQEHKDSLEQGEEEGISLKKHRFDFMTPFDVLSIENLHRLWFVFIIFLGMLLDFYPGIAEFNLERFLKPFKNGTLYTFSIALCIPYIAEISLSLIVDKFNKRDLRYLRYKMTGIIITPLFVLAMIICWLGVLRENIIAQCICAFIAIHFALYMRCIGLMDDYSEYFEDDYEKEKAKRTKRKAKRTKQIKGAKV